VIYKGEFKLKGRIALKKKKKKKMKETREALEFEARFLPNNPDA
jgi:hypothetical protein